MDDPDAIARPRALQSPERIQAYLAALRRRPIGRRVGVSPQTLAHAHAVLSGFHRRMERSLRLEPNPMRDVIRPRTHGCDIGSWFGDLDRDRTVCASRLASARRATCPALTPQGKLTGAELYGRDDEARLRSGSRRLTRRLQTCRTCRPADCYGVQELSFLHVP